MKKSIVTCIAAAAFWTSLAAADGPPVLDEIVVTDSRIEEKKRYISTHITTITRQELERSPADDLGELLAEKGIGHVQRYPGASSAIGVRGFRTDAHGNDLTGHVLVLINGRRAGTGNMTKLSTENIERVEILRGPGTVQYGSAGMGGVVNVITRRGAENSVSIEAGYGSFEEKTSALRATAKKGRFDFAGAFNYRSQNDYKTGDGSRYHNTGLDRRVTVSLNSGYTLAPGNRVALLLNAVDIDTAGNPGYLSQNDLDNTTDNSNISGDLIYEGGDAAGRHTWQVRYFRGRDKDQWFDPTDSNATGFDDGVPDQRTTDQQGAQLQGSSRLGNLTLTAGFDWADYEVESSFTPARTTYDNRAGLLLAKLLGFDQRLALTAGVRYDQYEVAVLEPAGRSESDNYLTPSMGLAWQATERLKLRGRYAEAFVMPSADQLAADYVSFGRRVEGNPDLKPETSSTWEAGLDYSPEALKASLTWFSTEFNDKIVYVSTGEESSSWENLGSASLSGLEGEFSFDIGHKLQWPLEVRPTLTFTWYARMRANDTGSDLKYLSRRQISGGLVVSDYKEFTVSLNMAYTGKQQVDDWESDAYPTPVVTLEDFFVTDLVASKNIYRSQKRGSFTLRGEVRNLFDENYAYVKGYPMPGRSFYVGLKWTY